MVLLEGKVVLHCGGSCPLFGVNKSTELMECGYKNLQEGKRDIIYNTDIKEGIFPTQCPLLGDN